MSPIDTLANLFTQFPGIGPRQAKRFVYFLLRKDARFTDALTRALGEVKKSSVQCSACFRYFEQSSLRSPVTLKACRICSNEDGKREHEQMMVVAHDVDVDNIEKADSYRGRYFVLGGLLPLLEQTPQKRIRIEELKKSIADDTHASMEIILALPLTVEGEHTRSYCARALTALLTTFPEKLTAKTITITTLGRGLSTGTELEYSDSDTIRYALESRR